MTDSTDNFALDFMPFHRFVTFPDLIPVDHPINVGFEMAIEDLGQSVINKLILEFLLVLRCS